MTNLYAFSFDRESAFRGSYATREQAAEAGQLAAREESAPIEAVYVGKRVAVNPQADGHAEAVVRAMKSRMLSRTGNASYLAAAHEHTMADLDTALTQALVAWLKRHNLEPAQKIGSISEHPLLTPREHEKVRGTSEVQMIGPDE